MQQSWLCFTLLLHSRTLNSAVSPSWRRVASLPDGAVTCTCGRLTELLVDAGFWKRSLKVTVIGLVPAHRGSADDVVLCS